MDAYDKDIWDAGRKVVSAIWDTFGWIWHGMSKQISVTSYIDEIDN